MPTAIVAVATAIGKAVVGATIAAAIGATATAIVGAVIVVGTVALAVKAVKRAKAAKALAAQAAGSAVANALVTKAGSNVSIPLIYGTRRISGQRVFLGSDGSKNEMLHIVESLCEGPVEGATEIYFNDELAATSSDNGASWTVESKYSGKAGFIFKDGSQTAALNSETVNLNGTSVNIHSSWAGTTKKGTNTAYMYIVLKFDQEVYGGGLPNITTVIKGKKVPAIGTAYNSALTYSADPARILYDYLINPNYGKGIDYNLIDTTSFNASSTYNNEQVDKSASDSTQATRYECHAYIDTSASLLDNVEGLMTTMRGGLITGDKYQLLQDKPRNTSGLVHIDDDRIVGSITYLQASKKTLMNGLRATFPDKDGTFNYQENITIVDSPTLQGSSYDGVKLQQDIELANTTDISMAERILTEEINQSRQSGVLEVTIDPRNIDLTVGDVIKFSNTTLGQTEKLYRIVKTVLRPNNELDLNLREYDDNVYWDYNTGIITNNKNDTDH